MCVRAPWGAFCPGVLALVMVVSLTVSQVQGHLLAQRATPSPALDTYLRNFTMPGVTPKVDEAYLCTAMKLNESLEEWVVKFDPLASANRAHHMLLFGCSDVMEEKLHHKFWDCGHHGVCKDSRIMYAWAKNAPTTNLPPGVGFRIGGQTGIRFLTLQIHYAKALPEGVKDHSGLQMKLTHQKQKYKAGIYLLVDGSTMIPPNTAKTHADVNCMLGNSGEPTNITLFAYRVHAHVLGTVITGYLFDTKKNEYTEIAKGNPQWPQAFYPMKKTYLVNTTNILHARCTWNSTNRSRTTYIGSTAADEMCNLYLMYYTDPKEGSEFSQCGSETFPIVTKNLPSDSDVPLPPNPLLEEHARGENLHKEQPFVYSTGEDNRIKVEKKGHSLQDKQNPSIDPQLKNLNTSKVMPVLVKPKESLEESTKAERTSPLYNGSWNSTGVLIIALGLMTIPIILTGLILTIQARRTGGFTVPVKPKGSLGPLLRSHLEKHEGGLNIGSLINKHHGFEKLPTEDPRFTIDSGDSDIEEFSRDAMIT